MTILSFSLPRLTTGAVALLLSSTAAATPFYDDLTLGTVYHVGSTDISSGVKFAFSDYEVSPGVFINAGSARIQHGPCTGSQELRIADLFVEYDYLSSIGPVLDPSILLEYSFGPVNLSVNGHRVWAPNLGALPSTVGGCSVTLVPLGGRCGRIDLGGTVRSFGFGSASSLLDSTGQVMPSCDLGYEDLAPAMIMACGTSFSTNGVPSKVIPFQTASSGPFTGGEIRVSGMNRACEFGYEIELRTAGLSHDFAATGTAYDNVGWSYGYYGGGVNFEINGYSTKAAHIIDLDGTTLGGCMISVVPTFGSCGKIVVSGVVKNMGIGGQELFVDCLQGDPVPLPIPGDVDGDGDVDIDDLMALLAAFGSTCSGCPEDIDGDGDVDINDLLILLSNYGT